MASLSSYTIQIMTVTGIADMTEPAETFHVFGSREQANQSLQLILVGARMVKTSWTTGKAFDHVSLLDSTGNIVDRWKV